MEMCLNNKIGNIGINKLVSVITVIILLGTCLISITTLAINTKAQVEVNKEKISDLRNDFKEMNKNLISIDKHLSIIETRNDNINSILSKIEEKLGD